MAGNSSFLRAHVEGVEDLKRVFAQIGDDLRKKTVQAALRDALQPVAAEARRLAPVGRDVSDRAVALLVVEHLKGKPRRLMKKALAGRALRDTITITSQLSKSQRKRRGRPLTEFEAFVSATAPHAPLVEFGHALVKGPSKKGKVLSHTAERDQSPGGTGSTRGRFTKHHVVRAAGAAGRVIGQVPAYPFLRPAFDAKKAEVLKLFAVAIRKRLEELVDRLGRQAARNTLSKVNRRALAMRRSQG